MRIKVVPRKWFEKIKGTKEEELVFNRSNIISIITPIYEPKNIKEESIPFSKKYENNENVLVLKFHDYDKKEDGVVLMSNEDCLKLKEFCNKIDHNKPLIIHCTAGRSRSYTIGSFLNLFYNKNNPCDYNEFVKFYCNDNKMIINQWVKNKLETFFI